MHKYFRPIMAAASTSFSGASLVPPLPSVRPHPMKRSETQSEPMLFSVLTPTEESEITYTLHEGTPQLSEEMLITRTCIEDHMMVTYMKALQQVWENCVRKQREGRPDVPIPEHHTQPTRPKNVPDRPPASNFDPIVLPIRSKTCVPDMQHSPWAQTDNASDPYQHEHQPSWFSRLFSKPAR
ncbi:hypothetical protein BC943DRAFT_316084 [Umbelopsis sp. AD052]|nr:hypothetical protein BC943DRAFT_316084 [Umbelopsis sp. AD052]